MRIAQSKLIDSRQQYQLHLLVADLVSLSMATVFSSGILHGRLWADALLHQLPGTVLLVALWCMALFVGEQYWLKPGRAALIELYQNLKPIALGTFAAVGICYVAYAPQLLSRDEYLVATGIATLSAWAVRLIALRLLPARYTAERYVLVGGNGVARSLLDALGRSGLPGYAQLEGVVSADGLASVAENLRADFIGELSDLPTLVEERRITHLVLCTPEPVSDAVLRAAMACQERGVMVLSPQRAFEDLTSRTPLFGVVGSYDHTWESLRVGKYCTRIKRVCDIVLMLAISPLALVLVGISAAAAKLTSPGPVFYRQTRVGKDGNLFTLAKLRTMVVDAEAHTGPVWATENDPRITPVGHVLRKLRLDELPQLYSVLRGDMSLIGPRPERPEFVAQFKPQIPMYSMRLLVRPGITGWAQIHQRYDSCIEDVIEKLQYDLYYIRHLTFSTDLQIVLSTIAVMIGCKGSR